MNFILETQDKYNTIKEAIKQKWNILTEQDLDLVTHGSKDRLIAKIVNLYGYPKEKVQDEINKLWVEEVYNEDENNNLEG